MKNQAQYILTILVMSFLVSCNRQDLNKSLLYELSPQTFNDDLIVEGTVEARHSSTIACPQRLNGTIIFLIEDGIMVEKGDTVCILENRESTNYYEGILNKVEQSKIQYSKSNADLEMNYALLKAQVESNNAQISITNLDSAQLLYLSPQQRKIKELELKIASIEEAKLKKKLEILDRINASELKKLKLQITQDENQAKHIKSIIDQMVMTAPQNGLALRAKSRRSDDKMKEGDEVWNGMALVEIPDLNEMKVTIQASESAYKRIQELKNVVYTFDAMPGNMAWGKIEKKAPMGKPLNRNSKVKYFEITASVDSFKVLPELGLSANCRVILSEVIDTIVVPQLAIFEEDSMKVVYVKLIKKFEKREVILGESSPKEAVVIVGLKGSETLTFEKPTNTKIKSTVLLSDSLNQDTIEKDTVKAVKNNLDIISTQIDKDF